MTTEKLILEFDAKATKLIAELDKVNGNLDKNKKKTKDSEEQNKKWEISAKGMAGAAVKVGAALTAGAVAFVAYATAQGRAIRETEIMAKIAGLSVDEFRKMSFVMGTVGVTAEQFGDIMKDTQEKIGDFLATGGGGFQDFADTMGYTKAEAVKLANEFERMSGQEVLQAMVNRMEAAGKSSQKMSFTLEGMASESTRLIPLLQENGKAAKELGETFNKLDVPLSEEERQQFKDLAENVDLAQTAFINFINNAIGPFLPAINTAAIALADFFSSIQTGMDLDDLLDDSGLVNKIKNVDELNNLETAANQLLSDRIIDLDKLNKLTNNGSNSRQDDLEAEIEQYSEISNKIRERREELSKPDKKASKLDSENAKGDLTGKTGVDTIELKETLEKELQARLDAQRSALQILTDERDERLKIIEAYGKKESELTEEQLSKKQQIEDSFKEQADEAAKSDLEKKIEAGVAELEALTELKNAGFEVEQAYQERLLEMKMEIAPETVDPEVMEEKNQEALELLNEKLENDLLSHEEYYQQLNKLGKKDGKDKEKRKETENFWSDSSTKKQMDDGMELLSALGNNSKTAHKIKQGLAASNAFMNTAEGVTKALSEKDFVSAALIAATGAAQVSAILASTPNGGGGSISAPSSAAPTQTEAPDTNQQSTTVTDISGGEQNTQRFAFEFSDAIIDVIAKKVKESKSEGRI